MTTKKAKMVIVNEPAIAEVSTLNAEVRKVFNTSVAKLIKITGDNENAVSNLSAVVEQQLYVNPSVIEKTVDITVDKTVEQLQRLVIPYTTWSEYGALIEHQEFKKGNWEFIGGEISTSEHTKLKSRATTILNRIKTDLESATVKIAFYWEACQSDDAIANDLIRTDAVENYGSFAEEIAIEYGLTPEESVSALVGDLAKEKVTIPKIGQKAIVDKMKSKKVAIEKEYNAIATAWLKEFKKASTAVKKAAIPELSKIKLS